MMLKSLAASLLIVLVTLAVLDGALMVTRVLPPKVEYGDPDLGWVAFVPQGRNVVDRCTENESGKVYSYARNAQGFRTDTASTLADDSSAVRIAVTGDSQTDLCATNDSTHAGILEAFLQERGVPAVTFAYGAGRYSPLQSYLAFDRRLASVRPRVFVLNLYTGNDFNDLLRIDDRPTLVREKDGYVITPPRWYRYADPNDPPRSRVVFLLGRIAERSGIQGLYFRLRFLYALANEQGLGLGTTLRYLRDLRKTVNPRVGYREAFTAQMLNQHLFFEHFPESRNESVRRLRALLQIAREAHPEIVLVLSVIPSYLLVADADIDGRLSESLAAVPIDRSAAVRLERALLEEAKKAAADAGWYFVDPLPMLRSRRREHLFNSFDYHLLPVASHMIGELQACVVAQALENVKPSEVSCANSTERSN